jgi:hypothetical protein
MKKSKKTIRCAVECAVLVSLLSVCRCSLDLAGASQVGNPASVVGCVKNTQQKPAAGAKVYLLTSQFIPTVRAADTLGDSGDLTGTIIIGADTVQFMTVTDSNGGFVISKVPQSTYNLFVSDSSVSEVAMRRNVVIDRSMVDVGTETMRKPGKVIFNITDTMFSANGYLAVMGTPLFQTVSCPGQYTLTVPDDTVSVVYTADTVNHSKDSKSYANVYAPSGDTVDMTGIPAVVINGALGILDSGWVVPITPADTIRAADSTVRFIVSGAYSNKDTALEYQFFFSHDTTPAVITNWSSANSYLLLVSKAGIYYVSYRVRSQTTTGPVISEWAPTCAVIIKLPGPLPSITVPRVPSVIDSAWMSDTLVYSFVTGGAASLLGDTVHYRFQMTNDTLVFQRTSWSWDTVATFKVAPGIGTYYISSQARSSADTTVFSAWSASDSLFRQ